MRTRARVGLALVAPLLAWTWGLAEVTPLTLYQKTARASLVVRARATSDSTRRPIMEVLRVFKGAYGKPRLVIVPFRREEVGEKMWLRPEVFRAGREYLLFLSPYDPFRDDDDFFTEDETPPSAGDGSLFVVLNAQRGVLELPAEGREALFQAVERFARITVMLDYDAQCRELRALLSEPNPIMVEAGLRQVAEYRLAQAADAEALVSLLDSSRPAFRSGAVKILGQLSAEPALGPQESQRIRGRIVSAALGDTVPQVRVEAVRALGRLGGDQARDLLARISRDDPDQEVRYLAEILLAEMTGAIPPEKGGGV